jgi:hypothetical protein
MPALKTGLTLSGWGELQEISQDVRQITIRIQNVNPFKRQYEEIIFVCTVTDPAFQAKLIKHQSALLQEQELQVKFTLQYQETIGFQYCRANNDPDHIVTIAAQLLALDVIESLDITEVHSDIPTMF